jgi:hypothetical protein
LAQFEENTKKGALRSERLEVRKVPLTNPLSSEEPGYKFSNQDQQYETYQHECQPSVASGAARERQDIFSISRFFSLGLLCEPLNSLLLFSLPVVALFHLPADSFYASALKIRFGSFAYHPPIPFRH